MKKIAFIAFLLTLMAGVNVFAQGDDDDNDDDQIEENDKRRQKNYRKGEVKTLAGNNYHSGGFGALSFKGTQYQGQTMVMAGIRGGWIINRAVALGFEGWGVIPTVQLSDIYPYGDIIVLGGYGGFFIEPIILSNYVVHLTFPVSGGAGWMGYHEDWNDYYFNDYTTLVDDDVYWYIEPGAALELNVSRHFRMDFGVSYRFTQDLELINTESDDFDDWNYFLTLKWGGF